MKKILTSLAAVGLAALITTGQPTEAKADGGVIIGIGAYLLIDALVGRHCHRDEWPLNIVRRVGDELRGWDSCWHHDGYHRHHRHHHYYHHHYHH
jgi:hypothetical protein